MPDGIGRVFAGVYKALEVFEESAQKLIGDLQNALAELESEVGAETSRLKSQIGQSQEQDIMHSGGARGLADSKYEPQLSKTPAEILSQEEAESALSASEAKSERKIRDEELHFKSTDEEPISVEEEIELSIEEDQALIRASIEPIELKGTLAKYRTHYDEARTQPRGWLLKLLDENDQETDDGNHWLCSVLVKWVQQLPRTISSRDENNNRDRAYPAKSKRSIYVNDGEMEFIEELAKEQNILVQEKEFNRQ